ncbi:MAG: DUF3558 family protein [Actinobacteria bacterium]|nr:DUF3558 family protein [Actinomycetota bacterium]
MMSSKTSSLRVVVVCIAAAAALSGCSPATPSAAPHSDKPAAAAPSPSAAPTVAAPRLLDTSKFDACTVLTQPEAETLIATALTAPLKVSTTDVASCTYAGDPSGPTAQVEIYVGSGAKEQLDVDRDKLQHAFTQPAGIGDEAWEEEGMIFARSGTTWVSIRIVTLDDPTAFVAPLQSAMTVALSRLA